MVWIGTHERITVEVVQPSESPFVPPARAGPTTPKLIDPKLLRSVRPTWPPADFSQKSIHRGGPDTGLG